MLVTLCMCFMVEAKRKLFKTGPKARKRKEAARMATDYIPRVAVQEAFIADSVYYAFWSCYNILCEMEKMEKRKGADP